MQFRRSPGVRPVDRDFHRGRQNARHNYFDIAQAGDIERVKYELDEVEISGRLNRRSYLIRRSIDVFGMNGTDIRTLKDR